MDCLNCECLTCCHYQHDCDGCADCDYEQIPKVGCEQYIKKETENL